jgi:hypothetical protein
MSSAVRVIRFARATAGLDPAQPGVEPVADVLLDEQPAPAGRIVRRQQTWHYLLADGSPAGLASEVSRHDLERQIVLYYLGTLPGSKPNDAEPPLQVAV